MIVVSRNDNGIKVEGHAHYAEPGKDIVCAGVFALVQNLISSIEELIFRKHDGCNRCGQCIKESQ